MSNGTTFPEGSGNNPPSEGSGSGGDIAAAVASITASGLDYASQRKTNRERAALEAAARKYNLEQWFRSNRYNHPLAQMLRLKEAGLNPNLIYGSSPGSAVGNAGAVPPGKAPEYSLKSPFQPGLEAFQTTRMNQAQTNNLKADANLKNTQAIKTGKDAGISGVTLQYLEDTIEPRTAMAIVDLQIKEIKKDLDHGMKPLVIANQITTNKKNEIATAMLNKENELMSQGYFKGNMIATVMKGVFNLDLSIKRDRLIAQIVASAALTSHMVGNMSNSFKAALEALRKFKLR